MPPAGQVGIGIGIGVSVSEDITEGGGPPPVTPELDFSVDTNSQYLTLGVV